MRRALIAVGVALGIVVGLNAAVELVNQVYGAEPGGPRSSAFATAPEGLAAYAKLLEGSGHAVVREHTELEELEPDPRVTLIVLDPQHAPTPEAVARLRAFVGAGGRLVAGGDWVGSLVDDPPRWTSGGVRDARALVPVAETAGVGAVRTAAEGAFQEAAATLPVLGADGRTTVAVAAQGAGRLVLLADASPLQNRLLAEADNAALGLAVAGPGRAVHFAESVHGYGPAQGLGALPASWRWMLGLLAVATLVWMVSRGRRLGPPEDRARRLAPPRREYVDALAGVLARTKQPQAALESVRNSVRRRVARRAGISPQADATTMFEAATSCGLAPDEAQAAAGSADVLALGRALAKLEAGP